MVTTARFWATYASRKYTYSYLIQFCALFLAQVFPRVVDDTAKKVELLLAGVVTYYGKHYSTFFYSNKLSNWIYFDDARVRKVISSPVLHCFIFSYY